MTELLPDPAVEHKRARNDAVEIHYVVAGRSEAVVLLHGFPQTWLPWRKIIPLLARHPPGNRAERQESQGRSAMMIRTRRPRYEQRWCRSYAIAVALGAALTAPRGGARRPGGGGGPR
jgi:hypothetical protein